AGFRATSRMTVRNTAVISKAKFARFRTLKNSARNCTLKLSEILLIELFLNSEKSRFIRPGLVKMLRPELPRRLKHCRGAALNGGALGSLGWALGGCGSQFAFQNAKSGAVDTAKHWVLM